MENYPYWAYVSTPGALDADREKEALDEGRRLAALTLAVEYQESSVYVLETASRFEAYLKGDRLLELEADGRG